MRSLDYLHHKVKEKALLLQKKAKEKNVNIVFIQTLRTNEEQTALYAQGRKSLEEVNKLRALAKLPLIGQKENSKIVTKAQTAADSFHGYGLAFDIAIIDTYGKKIDWDPNVDWDKDGVSDWTEVGQLAEECDLEWGGNWTAFPDIPHYQDRRGFTIAKLKKDGYKPGVTIQCQ